MASYIISEQISIERQEDDSSDLEIVVPDSLDMSLFTEIKFLIETSGKAQKLLRKLSDAGITLSGQTITVVFEPEDLNFQGTYRWELEVSNPATSLLYTIGQGLFILRDKYLNVDA